MPPLSDVQLAVLAQRFMRFADQECGDYAPLYDRLARGIARDPELLTLAAHARSGQQAPLLLAAVHFLLLGGADHALGTFYPSVVPRTAVPSEDVIPAFHAFCRNYHHALHALVSTGRVQTNEPRRCTVLLLAFATVARLAGDRPLALIRARPYRPWPSARRSHPDGSRGGTAHAPRATVLLALHGLSVPTAGFRREV